MPADYLHATSDSCRTVTRLLTVKVCRWDCATCFVRHKLMQSNCIINSCHFVKPSHKERTLGNHAITSFDISTLCSVICSQVQWIQMDSRKCLRWWKSCGCEHYEIAGKLICVCVFLEEVWHRCNRKAWTTCRFGETIMRSSGISRTKHWFTLLASEYAFRPFTNDKPVRGIIRRHPWLRTILEHRLPVPHYNTSIILTSKTTVWFPRLATEFSGQV